MATKPTPAKTKTFKHAQRWSVLINAEFVDIICKTEKEARAFARCMYVGDNDYRAAIKSKEIEILKLDLRPAKK